MICNVFTEVLQERRGLFSDPDDAEDESLLFAHHKTAASIETSAAADCNKCHPFWRQLSHEEQSVLLANKCPNFVTLYLLQRAKTIDRPNWYVLIVVLDSRVSLGGISKKKDPALSMFVLEPNSELESFRFGYPASNSTRSDECWHLASQWIKTCQKQHPAFREGATGRQLRHGIPASCAFLIRSPHKISNSSPWR